MDNEEKLLLKAALTKLMNDEPLALADLHRIIDLIESASFQVDDGNPDSLAGAQSRFIGVLQNRFMKGQPQS